MAFYLVANTSSVAADVQVTLLNEANQSLPSRRYAVPPNSRLVERAMYSDAVGVFWAAGTNLLATRLR